MPIVRNLLDVLTRNWKLKLFAFGLALLLWFMVTLEDERAREISVPLAVQVTDAGYRVDPASVPRNVTVRMIGRGTEIGEIAVRRPPLRVRIDDVSDTVQSVFLSPDMIELPAGGVRAQAVSPDVLQLRFIRMGSRTVPVAATISQPPGPGRVLVDSLTITPPNVFVRAPLELISEVDTIYTNPIDLSEIDSAFNLNVSLNVEQLNDVELAVERVEVSGRIDDLVESSFNEVPISVGSGVRIIPSSVDVTLRGPESHLSGITASNLRVVISIDSIPRSIPAEGLLVPLRVERLGSGVQVQVQPRTARLYPAAPPEGATEDATEDGAAPEDQQGTESPDTTSSTADATEADG